MHRRFLFREDYTSDVVDRTGALGVGCEGLGVSVGTAAGFHCGPPAPNTEVFSFYVQKNINETYFNLISVFKRIVIIMAVTLLCQFNPIQFLFV